LQVDVSDAASAEPAPGLGGSKSAWLQGPAKFYAHWENFSTTRDFAFCDKYNPNDAPNRQVRLILNPKPRSD